MDSIIAFDGKMVEKFIPSVILYVCMGRIKTAAKLYPC